jgi:chemotaxis protein CheZ
MSAVNTLQEFYGPSLERLTRAISLGDTDACNAALDALVERREGGVRQDLRALTDTLVQAMENFRQDFRLEDLAGREVPDARVRLNHVLSLTDAAAHKTMDLIEACGPLAGSTGRAAAALAITWRRHSRGELSAAEAQEFPAVLDKHLADTQSDCEKLRENLGEVMLTQGYQDITGQIIRGVITLVGDVEKALEQLVRLAGGKPGTPLSAAPAPTAEALSRGFGPAVPGITTNAADGQDDIDQLMAGLGI